MHVPLCKFFVIRFGKVEKCHRNFVCNVHEALKSQEIGTIELCVFSSTYNGKVKQVHILEIETCRWIVCSMFQQFRIIIRTFLSNAFVSRLPFTFWVEYFISGNTHQHHTFDADSQNSIFCHDGLQFQFCHKLCPQIFFFEMHFIWFVDFDYICFLYENRRKCYENRKSRQMQNRQKKKTNETRTTLKKIQHA